MSEVWFYHLDSQRVENALTDLLIKVQQKQIRVLVSSSDEERLKALDSHLWTFRDDSFLPHGLDTEPHADSQPVLLSNDVENINAATMLFCLDGRDPGTIKDWDRVIVMFENHDQETVGKARDLWKTAKADGIEVSYWRQSDTGRWEKQS